MLDLLAKWKSIVDASIGSGWELLHDVAESVFHVGVGGQRALCVVSLSHCVALPAGRDGVYPTLCCDQACAQAKDSHVSDYQGSSVVEQPGRRLVSTAWQDDTGYLGGTMASLVMISDIRRRVTRPTTLITSRAAHLVNEGW